MLKKITLSLIIMLLMVGCENNIMSPEIEEQFLDVYSTQQMDKNGYYHYPYTGYNYGSIYFETTPMTLVGWTSPDEFCIQFFEELKVEFPELMEEVEELGIDPNDLYGQARAWNNIKTGADGIGAIVRPNTGFSVLAENDIKLFANSNLIFL